jgi:hypothetical protein
MTNPRNFVKRVSPTIKVILRVGKTLALIFTGLTLIFAIHLALGLIAGYVLLHFGPVAGFLTLLLLLSSILAIAWEFTRHV